MLSQMKARQVQVPCWPGQPSLPSLFGAGFPAPSAVPQHPCAVSAPVLVEESVLLTKQRWDFGLGPSVLSFTGCQLPKLQARPFHRFRPTNLGDSSWEACAYFIEM